MKKPVRNIADYKQWSAQKQCRSNWVPIPSQERIDNFNLNYATRDGAMLSVTNLQDYAVRKLRYQAEQNMAYVNNVLSKLSTTGE